MTLDIEAAICPSSTPIKLKKRRHCAGCGKTLWGAGFAKCFDCRESEKDTLRQGKRLCVDCGDPVSGRRLRCAPCWRDTDREARHDAAKKWKLSNPEKVREHNRRWRKTEKGRVARKAYLKRWKKTPAGRACRDRAIAAWKLRNPEKVRQYRARYEAKKRGALNAPIRGSEQRQ